MTITVTSKNFCSVEGHFGITPICPSIPNNPTVSRNNRPFHATIAVSRNITLPRRPDRNLPGLDIPAQHESDHAMSGRGRKKTKPFMETHRDEVLEGLTRPVRQNNKPQITLTAQTATQKVYLRKLDKRHHDILIATGPAGTGKTYLAVVQAIKELRSGKIKKIIITRPNVGAGDDLGHLPGTLIEKMAPWMQPVLDVFKEFYEVHEVERMIRDEVIEIAPLVFMRGRTLKNAFIVADEMQNATPEQMKMFLTRIGENSMMIITGDMEQHDRPDGQVSGLTDFIQRFRARDGLLAALGGPIGNDNEESYTSDYNSAPEARSRIGFVGFGIKDVVRHEVIEEVLSLYA